MPILEKLAILSHLLQMRGLKLKSTILTSMLISVASFTDAWIETCIICRKRKANAVASFTDAWIETKKEGEVTSLNIGRIFYRCVD